MSRLLASPKYFTILLVAFVVGSSIPIGVSAQSATHLTFTQISGQAMTAGFNNTASFTVLNSYYGYSAIYDVDVSVSAASSTFPLALYGDNHWHYQSIQYGQSVTINMTIYAPTSAAGSTYQGDVTINYKRLGDISYTSETHTLSFAVYGSIILTLYGIQLTPASTAPGGNLTISGNLLNSGNLAAYNANVSVTGDILAPGTSSSSFIGEVDPNIPRPFSVQVFFVTTVKEGNYSLTVRALAFDQSRLDQPFITSQTVGVQIRRPLVTGVSQRSSNTGLIGEILAFLRSLFEAFFGTRYTSNTPVGGSEAESHSYFSAATGFILDARHAG